MVGFIAANFGDIAARVYLLLAVAVATVVLYLVVEVMVYLQSKRPQPPLAADEINLTELDRSPVSSSPEPLNTDDAV